MQEASPKPSDRKTSSRHMPEMQPAFQKPTLGASVSYSRGLQSREDILRALPKGWAFVRKEPRPQRLHSSFKLSSFTFPFGLGRTGASRNAGRLWGPSRRGCGGWRLNVSCLKRGPSCWH